MKSRVILAPPHFAAFLSTWGKIMSLRERVKISQVKWTAVNYPRMHALSHEGRECTPLCQAQNDIVKCLSGRAQGAVPIDDVHRQPNLIFAIRHQFIRDRRSGWQCRRDRCIGFAGNGDSDRGSA
jgi:hypothetical protein